MAISVRNAASPGGVLTTSFGVGQGSRRNRVQEMALSAMERRKAQQRTIRAQEASQRRGIAANERSQERAIEDRREARVFGERSKRRTEAKRLKSQERLQDKAFDQRTESQVRGISARQAAQERGFEQQTALQEATQRNRTAATQARWEREKEQLDAKAKGDRAKLVEQREFDRGILEERREFEAGAGDRRLAQEEIRHTATQERRLRDLADQEARIMSDETLTEDEKDEALAVVKQSRFGIKPVPQKPKELTFEQKQKATEFEFKQQQETNKLKLEASKSAMQAAKNAGVEGGIDMKKYREVLSENMKLLGIDTGVPDSSGKSMDLQSTISKLSTGTKQQKSNARKTLIEAARAGDQAAREALERREQELLSQTIEIQ